VTGNQVRVAILAEHDVVHHGLAAMLGTAGMHTEPWEPPDSGGPFQGTDVVLYDAARLASRGPDDLDRLIDGGVPVVVVVSALRPDLHAEAMVGRRSVAAIDISMSASEMAAAIAAAAAGEPSPTSLTIATGERHNLSAREAQILGLIARGHTNLEIANLLFLSINSIKTYIRSAYRKIGVTRRSQAVVWAAGHGFPIEELVESPAQIDHAHYGACIEPPEKVRSETQHQVG
jgi:DNA-binding CsgD family transcriptional regulator